MKKQTLIYLAIAAGIGYYFYSKKNKTKSIPEQLESIEPADNEAPKPSVRKYPKLPKQLPMYSYNAATTLKPVATTLDTMRNAIFQSNAPKAFSLKPQTKSKKQAPTKAKKQAKKAKLGILGASYLYV
jgi:hypothetical protein